MISQLAQAIGSTGCVGSASLMHGVIPAAVAVITVVALLYAVGRRWRSRLLPIAAAIGVATGVGVHWFYGTLGLASEPPPRQMWAWVSLTGFSGAVAVAGWRSAGWWRRNASVFATSFCLLSTGLTINGWLGYFPSVYAAWGQLTNAPLPNQSDWRTVDDMRSKSIAPQHGIVVAVDTGNNASGFRHRTEWVYLPPTWFTAKQPTRLPAVLMIGGEFNTPPDWIRAGDAVTALDEFAAAHGGNAPIAVFADATGGFTIDTECVNGPRGNAADHLTADVVPMINAISGSHEPPLWGVVGFSSGATCAVDLAVMHPNTFSAFVDIGGDIAPNAGNRTQTIDRLFGGDAAKWSSFDPSTVISRHGDYPHLSGVFAVPGTVGRTAAESLCNLGQRHGIDCRVVALPGSHDWPSAASAFAATLPWLASRLHTPGVTKTGMP
jgi:S-formylglutathione hydrolase FrmB